MYENASFISQYQRTYIRAEHQFDLDNKITLEWYKKYAEKYVSPGDGALLQLFNKIGAFDIYNELVYRANYETMDIKIDKGFDYTLGVIYPVNKHLLVKLKGENLLNEATQIPIGDLKIPAMETRYRATMEYTF